ncbi:MAG: APC family permease, partial [Cyanobacteria bacterium]|nr:APC family permease [Cyanobacteriota bacterium]
ALQWRGIRWGSSLQVATAVIKTVALLVLVIACFVLGSQYQASPPDTASQAVLPAGWALVSAVMLALQAVLYTIDGWNGVIYFGEEVKDPARNVPKAIFGSVISIILIYVLLNAAVLFVLPMSQITGNHFALGSAAERIFGKLGDPVMRSIIVVSLLSCINAVQLFCSRILYTMSCDGLFFRAFAQVNEGGTPLWALALSTVVGIIFVLGSFERVSAMLSFFFVANYTLSYLSLFVLRRREPDMERPYRAWGYPFTSAVALVASALFLIGSLWTDRENAPLALIILCLSYPTFLLFKRYARQKA